MAGTSGHGGSITFANLTVGVKNWSLDIDANMLESTDFDSSGLREYVTGLKGWSGSCSINWSSTNTVAVGDTGSMTLQYTGGQTVAGTIFVSGISYGVDVDGLNSADLTFQGSGALPA